MHLCVLYRSHLSTDLRVQKFHWRLYRRLIYQNIAKFQITI